MSLKDWLNEEIASRSPAAYLPLTRPTCPTRPTDISHHQTLLAHPLIPSASHQEILL
jgi:hypothetical protein